MLTLGGEFRRHAERTGQIWLQKIRDSPPPKRLNLIYLANGTYDSPQARFHWLNYILRGGPAIESPWQR
jgi:hypothetical protein